MTWFKVDDSLAFHAKVVAAGNAGMGLWVRAGAWCSQQLTDGHVPAHMVPALGKISEARRLVEVGLWESVEGGFRFWQWSERNPTKEQVEEDRSAARERMKKARDAKCSGEQEPNTERSSPVVAVTPSRPVPSRPKQPTSGGAPPASAAIVLTDRPPDAGTVVAAYVDAIRTSDGPLDNRAKGRIAKDAAALLADGAPVALLIDAAQRLAVNGYADIGAEARRLHGERSVTPIRRPSASEAAANAALEAGARVAARHAAQEGA